VDRVEFEDHHQYRPYELQRIAAHLRSSGATAVLTTEKDAVNLCDASDDQLEPLPLYWLKVSMKIEGESELLDEIERRIR
jgi:tetraacyldisaccharide-1-P 4'-kinase